MIVALFPTAQSPSCDRWAAAGDVYTRARLAECAAHGVDAKLTAETTPPAKGGRV